MDIAFFDVFNPIPINSGGDWYRYYLLDEIGRSHDVIGYYNVSEKFRKGYVPPKLKFRTQLLESTIDWRRVSRNLEIFRPEFMFRNKVIGSIEAESVFFSTVCYHIAKKVAEQNDAPLILVMHNVEWQYLRDNGSILSIPMRAVEDRIIKKADAVITLSRHDMGYAQRLARGKVFYCPPAIDRTIFHEEGEKYNFGTDKFNILFYGSLDRKQNVDAARFIINELSPALSRAGLNDCIRLNIFGSGEAPQFLKDNYKINFHGAVDNPGNYIRGADAVIAPIQNSGGVKIRILESLACGRPVIASSEAAEGLPSELRGLVRVADTCDEYIDQIKQLIMEPKGKSNAHYAIEGDRLEDVIEYARNGTCASV